MKRRLLIAGLLTVGAVVAARRTGERKRDGGPLGPPPITPAPQPVAARRGRVGAGGGTPVSPRWIALAAAVAVGLVVVGVGVASWAVSGEGKAGGTIGELRPLTVELAKGDADALPGQDLALRAVVTNPNDIPLEVTAVSLTDDLTVDGKDGCNASLKDVRSLEKADGLTLKPGANEITVGTVRLPKQLDQECAGATVTGKVRVVAAFGA